MPYLVLGSWDLVGVKGLSFCGDARSWLLLRSFGWKGTNESLKSTRHGCRGVY